MRIIWSFQTISHRVIALKPHSSRLLNFISLYWVSSIFMASWPLLSCSHPSRSPRTKIISGVEPTGHHHTDAMIQLATAIIEISAFVSATFPRHLQLPSTLVNVVREGTCLRKSTVSTVDCYQVYTSPYHLWLGNEYYTTATYYVYKDASHPSRGISMSEDKITINEVSIRAGWTQLSKPNNMSSPKTIHGNPTFTETQSSACTHDDNKFKFYNCLHCAARQEESLKESHYELMRHEGWTEAEVREAPMQQFVTKLVITIVPGPGVPERRSWGRQVVEEQNARFEAGRKWRAERNQRAHAGRL